MDDETPDEPEDKLDDDEDISRDSLIKAPKGKGKGTAKPAANGKGKAAANVKAKPKAKKT